MYKKPKVKCIYFPLITSIEWFVKYKGTGSSSQVVYNTKKVDNPLYK